MSLVFLISCKLTPIEPANPEVSFAMRKCSIFKTCALELITLMNNIIKRIFLIILKRNYWAKSYRSSNSFALANF